MKTKKTLFLTIAISGSGKSWYIKNKLQEDFKDINEYLTSNNLDISELVVSPDLIRKELTGDISNQEKDAQIWSSIVYSRIKEKLNTHNYCIFDATNLSKRKSFLKHFKNVKKIGLIFKPDLNLSIERINEDLKNNVDRSKVSDYIVKKQYNKFLSSVVYFKWDGVWNKVIKKKIKERLLKEENLEIIFV